MTAPLTTATSGSVGDGGAGGKLKAVAIVYRWELHKLVAQGRIWLGVAAATLTPMLFLISIAISKVTPNDGPYADPLGPALRHSGLALTPVVITEVNYIGPAILVALVAGDIVAGEDMAGTLKTILIRSIRRGQILAGKTLALFTYVVVALFLYAAVGVIAGVVTWGFHPLRNLSGDRMSAGHVLWLTMATVVIYAVPVLAMASFGLFLSVLTRQSVAAVVGTLFYVLMLQGLGAVHAISWIHPYILNTQLTTWQGLFHTPTDWAVILHGLWVSALYTAAPLLTAWQIIRRRDIDS